MQKFFHHLNCKVILCLPCENQIDPVTWWRSRKFHQKSFISLSLATKREIWKSETMSWKTILMRSFWYQNFEDPTIHVTVATDAKFWGLKLQNRFTHAKLRGRDLIFRHCPIIRTCSFTWNGQHKFLPTLANFRLGFDRVPILTHPQRSHSHSNYQQFFLHKSLHEQVLKLPKKISFSEKFFLNELE